MSASTPPNERPLKQIQAAASALVDEGNSEEALELVLSALSAVLTENARLELLLLKLRKSKAGKSSSEKLDAEQLSLLFQLLGESEDEEPDVTAQLRADAELDKEIEEAEAEDDEPKTKRQRNKALNAPDLEERHTYLDPPDDQADWEVVGETTTERLRFSPAHFYKEIIHQPIMQDPEPHEDGSEGHVVVDAPPTVVPGGTGGNDVIAMLLIRKFAEHSTLYRLHEQFLREQGVEIPHSTLGDWVAWGGRALQRLIPPLLERATSAFLVGTDATGLRVLDSGPENVHRGTFHIYRGTTGEADEADIVFDYTPTGEAEGGPWRVLAGREGYVQADASNSFDRLFNGKVASATEVGCHFHARRPFKAHDDDPRTAYVLLLVRRLFKLERLADAKKLTPDERTEFRGRRSVPVLEKLKRYFAKLIRDGTPDDPLRKGAIYYINHWEALTRFTEDGRLPLTNNAVEYEFRGIRIGERNYLFAGSDEAAERAAAIYSVLATAKAYELNLFDYLVDILNRLSHPLSQDQIAELLPHRWKELHVEDDA
jgi:transposase